MSSIFVDTAGWGHLFVPTEQYHALAASIYGQVQDRGSKLITTNYIVTEVVALLTSPFKIPRPKVIELVQDLRTAPNVEIVHVDRALDEQAWDLLSRRRDKSWSLVDCSSFIIMQQRGIYEALTTDHHFEQAGFVTLLKT